MPKLSIIVPVYRVEPYLRQCVESILSQSFSDFELILIDDGSPDRCGSICDEYASRDERIKVIHQNNQGIGQARNVGLDCARGQYLGFIDSDDWLKPDMYATLISLADAYDADIAECAYLKTWDGGRTERDNHSKQTLVIDGMTALRDYTRGNYSHVVVWNKVYRKALWDQVRFPMGKLHEDVATTYKLYYKAGRVVQFDAAMMYYRQRGDSFMGVGFDPQRISHAREAYAEKIEFFNQKGLRNLGDQAAVEANVYLAEAYLGVSKETELKSMAPALKKEFDINYRELVKTGRLAMKDRLVLGLFYTVPLLYAVYKRVEIGRYFKQNKVLRLIYEWLS